MEKKIKVQKVRKFRPENIINDLRFFFLSPAAKKQPLSFEFIARHFCRKKVDFPAI